MFKVTVGLLNVGEFKTFSEAFRVFFTTIRETLERGASLQWLETCNSIAHVGNGMNLPMDFYQARDFAYEIGLLADKGELRDLVEEPSNHTVMLAFQMASVRHMTSFVTELKDTLVGINNALTDSIEQKGGKNA